MKVIFFSNYLNHHQLPFCLAMKKITNNNFYFIATEKTPKNRIALGYENMNEQYDFVIKEYEKQNADRIIKLVKEADIMIVGGYFPKYTQLRTKTKKIMFRYNERIYKTKFNLKTWASLIKNYTIEENKNVFLLCASAFTTRDFNMSGAYINKCYKWGYFPDHIEIKNLETYIQRKNSRKILWVGRLLDWKHPEIAINVAKKLVKDKINFDLEIIGNGPQYAKISKLIKKNKLEEKVHLIGSLPFQEVRKKMKNANIFLFTSDRREGWGAVLNEAMDSACLIIANSEIGSTPYLIQNNKNGYIYNTENDLYILVKNSLLNPQQNKAKQIMAYETIAKEWNANIAAQRLILLSKALQSKNQTPFKTGPCSKAKIIRG